jgi:hypothetical protein
MSEAPWEETLPKTWAGYFPQMNADLFRRQRKKDPQKYTLLSELFVKTG